MKKFNKSKVSILFVEEDETARLFVSTRLEVWGYRAESVSTIRDAVKIAEKEKFDLILLDWYYKDGTGLELCEMIRSFDTETPILFYTGVALDAKLEKAKRAGARGFIGKPIEMDEFIEAVDKHIQDHNFLGKDY